MSLSTVNMVYKKVKSKDSVLIFRTLGNLVLLKKLYKISRKLKFVCVVCGKSYI